MGNSQTKKLAQKTQFDKKEVKQLRDVFDSVLPADSDVDSNSNGDVSEKFRKFRKSLNSLRKTVSEEHEIDREQFKKLFQQCCGIQEFSVDLDKVFESVDADKNGKVSFQEMILWLAVYKKGTLQDKLRHVFQAFDQNHTGVLKENEVAEVVEVLKSSFKKKGKDTEAAWSLVKYLDENKDGKITEIEWISMGEQAGLIQAILGDDFLEMMERFSIPGKKKEEEKTYKQKKGRYNINTEGNLSVLMPELRNEVFKYLDDFATVILAMQVNKRWKKEMEELWYSLCKKKGYLEHEEWWKGRGKNWKWIFRCKWRVFKDEDGKNGIGTHESQKAIYEGEWVKGKKTGWGKITWKVGGYYLGQWLDNFREGYGFQVYSGPNCEGDTYEGQWHKSNRDGKGTYCWKASGDRYIGDWKLGKKHGHGVFYFAKSGNRYEGTYAGDKRNGKGTFHWANGDVYNGSWWNGEKQGIGTYTWASGLQYTGSWRRNLKCGNGVMVWPNGAKYDGLWNRNRINGKGVYIWPDGDRFEGEWANNCRRGKGYLYTNKGKVKTEQEWDERASPALADMKDLKKFPDESPIVSESAMIDDSKENPEQEP